MNDDGVVRTRRTKDRRVCPVTTGSDEGVRGVARKPDRPALGGARQVVPLEPDHLLRLPGGCAGCLFWELDPVRRARVDPQERTAAKRAWLAEATREWGRCGQVALVDGEVAGYALYAPQSLLPGAASFPTAPVSPDAVLLAGLRVAGEHAGGGLGRMLVQAMARDLVGRAEVCAVEAFGSGGPAGRPGDRLAGTCTAPTGFLAAVGFRPQRPHALSPRMRMDLRTALTWREEMGAALGRLAAVIRPLPKPARPSPPTREGWTTRAAESRWAELRR